MSTFHETFRERRLALGLTLRAFCERYGFDPSNISRLERGRMAPPQDDQGLARYADALELPEGSPERRTLYDLAYAERGIVPPELLSDEQVLERLPLVYRTLRGEAISDEQFNELVALIRRS